MCSSLATVVGDILTWSKRNTINLVHKHSVNSFEEIDAEVCKSLVTCKHRRDYCAQHRAYSLSVSAISRVGVASTPVCLPTEKHAQSGANGNHEILLREIEGKGEKKKQRDDELKYHNVVTIKSSLSSE